MVGGRVGPMDRRPIRVQQPPRPTVQSGKERQGVDSRTDTRGGAPAGTSGFLLVEVFKPLLLADLLRAFVAEYGEPANAGITLQLMQQSLLTAPTYLRAIKDSKDKHVAYLWATLMGGTCLIHQVFSYTPKARFLLFTDLERWCRQRGCVTLSGLRRLDRDTPAFRRWSKRRGYQPMQVLYMKRLDA